MASLAYRRLAALGLACFCAAPLARTQSLTTPAHFDRSIKPLLKEYCLTCHSTEKHKGDFDLEQHASPAGARRHPKIWQSVAEQLANNEMPPKDKPQLAPADKTRLLQWIEAMLADIAKASAGDPGPVVLRRLSNAEYTYTVRDLTGLATLDPAREFPVDGAAGEGFMNTGQALVMSPSLVTKYLDAGKEIAAHALLLPDGLRFSTKTTRRDWAEEILGEIRAFYREFTDPRGGDQVNLQGIVFETNAGGRLPVDKYLAATLILRDAPKGRRVTVETVAREQGLNAKYLGSLTTMLAGKEPSLLLDDLRRRWRAAKPADAPALAVEVEQWQKALWKFSSVGHIGKAGGPKAWMEPVNSLAAKQEVRIKLPAAPEGKEITLYLVASDAGDGAENDFVVWEQPRLVAPGRPNLLLKDARVVSRELARRRERLFASAAKCLNAAAEASTNQGALDVPAFAARHGVEAADLAAWLDYLGIGSGGPVKITSYFTNQFRNTAGYDFVQGWGSHETPALFANSSGQAVRIPGYQKAHGITVHPSPKLQVATGWRAPMSGPVRVSAAVTHAHPECGNGVTWSLELRRGATRQRLAAGTAQGAREVKAGPLENLAVQPGDLISLLIGPRDGNHSCDLTAIDLIITATGENSRTWDLAADVSPDVLAANPHADRQGNADVWQFYTEPDKGGDTGPVIPSGSLLAKWQSAPNDGEKQKLATALQALLQAGPPVAKDSPDALLHRQLSSLGGPLFSSLRATLPTAAVSPANETDGQWGLDPAAFGKSTSGQPIDGASLGARAPSVIEIRLPAELAAGCEFVTTGALEAKVGAEGSVQLQVLTNKPPASSGLLPSAVAETQAKGMWTSNNRGVAFGTPIIANEGSRARQRIEAGFDDFRKWFPAALCYAKIVPVDEVVTLTLFHREDDQLARLMLDDAQKAKLDRLWDQFHYVSHDAVMLVDVFEQLWQYATQDADPKVFEPLRQPIKDRAAAFKKRLVDTEPAHVQAVVDFVRRAYRRPVTPAEADEVRSLYRKLRAQELPHDDAIRMLLARAFVSPAFLYRAETPAPGVASVPVNDWELANRLSYFLWSSMPDQELSAAAAAGKLRDKGTLVAQTKRMLRDPRARRLATEFACQWLHIRDFDTLDEKSERHFPTFGALRGAMYEESIRFFTDFFQRDGSVLGILDADHTFLNESLARHYGIPGVTGEEWRRVDGIRQHRRGGILGQATTLAKQSGASRTSPILRGNWVAEVLLGDKLPKPPKDVPRLPEDEATETLTVRQLTEKHSTDPRCAGCHARIDAFGCALEGFDAIGRWRDRDLGDRPINTKAKVMDGSEFDGLDGLREYLLTKRRQVFVRQFCRKLLGYSLGRAVQLSDGPLLTEMGARLQAKDYHVSAALEAIVTSRQFREIRGRDMVVADEAH